MGADLADPATLVPPLSTLIDVVLALVVFGVGISLLVAPLTTALMSSVPVRQRRAGIRDQQRDQPGRSPLVSAVLFIAITASFYPTLARLVPGVDVDEPAVRAQIQPLTSAARRD